MVKVVIGDRTTNPNNWEPCFAEMKVVRCLRSFVEALKGYADPVEGPRVGALLGIIVLDPHNARSTYRDIAEAFGAEVKEL